MKDNIKQYLETIGKIGGNKTKERYGIEHYKEIGRKGGRISRRGKSKRLDKHTKKEYN